jgi:hypothetical protein
MQAAQRFPEPLLRRRGSEIALLPELCDHGAHIRRANAQLE